LRLEPYDTAKHYALIAAWWKARGDECLPADVLPPTGAVVTRDGEPIALCSIWLTNAKAAYLAFPITAPGLSPKVAYASMVLAIQGAVDIAKLAGCKFIWASTANNGVDRIFTKHVGFTRTTPHHNHFLLLDPALSHDTLVGEDFHEPKG